MEGLYVTILLEILQDLLIPEVPVPQLLTHLLDRRLELRSFRAVLLLGVGEVISLFYLPGHQRLPDLAVGHLPPD